MEQGSLGERYLDSAVLKNVRKINTDAKDSTYVKAAPDVKDTTYVGAAVGQDFSVADDFITADGVGETPVIAWTKAMNNFACSLGRPYGVRLLLMLPDTVKESQIKKYMECFDALAHRDKVQIFGGHSDVSPVYSKARFAVSVYGSSEFFENGTSLLARKKIISSYDIVMVGFAGMLGTNILLDKCREQLEARLPKNYLEKARFTDEELAIMPFAKKISEVINSNPELEVSYLHDVSHGGVYSALWQLGRWANKGIEVENDKIPIRQETVEICEALDLNPYLLEGTGALLMVCQDGRGLVRLLNEALQKECSEQEKKSYSKQEGELPISIIGKITDAKERIVRLTDSDLRTLAPVSMDEVHRI